mmetsp:Transcript_91578/g.255867  ORF Transcript_91578/g.255867 Transcript_91578/m.255867 type:complete len:293 (+) Transcript_91578:5002-5880(+)
MLMSFLASVIFSCASLAALSISSMACFKRSPDSSGGSAMSGAAKDVTASTASTDKATTSCVAGNASSSFLQSVSSCAFVAAAVSAAFFALATVACALDCIALTFWFSSASCCWTFLNRGDNFENSVTMVVAEGPPRRASLMSTVRDFCTSCKTACCFCNCCCTSWMALPSLLGLKPSAAATAFCAPASKASTCAVAFRTFAARAPAAGEGGGGGGAELPKLWEALGAGVAEGALPASTQRRPGSARGASHGTFQPARGGVGPWEAQRAQTWEPPTWSPNHQPLKSDPSRWSQ